MHDGTFKPIEITIELLVKIRNDGGEVKKMLFCFMLDLQNGVIPKRLF